MPQTADGTTILTLRLDPEAQRHFDARRSAHFPAERNYIAAHLTLFHVLPATAETAETLRQAAAEAAAFSVEVVAVMSLGRGVAFRCESAGLMQLHKRLTSSFAPVLSPQDSQGFRPHIVVQNKVSAEAAKALRETLEADFSPWSFAATGLEWWDYLGGPWRLREQFPFATNATEQTP